MINRGGNGHRVSSVTKRINIFQGENDETPTSSLKRTQLQGTRMLWSHGYPAVQPQEAPRLQLAS